MVVISFIFSMGVTTSKLIASRTTEKDTSLTDKTGGYGSGYDKMKLSQYDSKLIKSSIFDPEWIEKTEGKITEGKTSDASFEMSDSYSNMASSAMNAVSTNVELAGTYGGFSAALDVQYGKAVSKSETRHAQSIHSYYKRYVGRDIYVETNLENPVGLPEKYENSKGVEKNILNETFLSKIEKINNLAQKLKDAEKYNLRMELNKSLLDLIDYYGTHVITRVEKGAYFEHVFSMFMSTQKLESEQISELKSTLSAGYGGLGSVGIGVGSADKLGSISKKYSYEQESTVKTIGGDPRAIGSGIINKVDEIVPLAEAWLKTVEKTDYVVMDVNGKTIFEYVPQKFIFAKDVIEEYTTAYLKDARNINEILNNRYPNIESNSNAGIAPVVNKELKGSIVGSADVVADSFTESQFVKIDLSSHFDNLVTLKNHGVTSVSLKITVDSNTVNPGYRSVYLFADSNINEQNTLGMIVFSDKEENDLTKRTLETIISLKYLKSNNLYLRLKASGFGSNKWKFTGGSVTATYMR